jgi:hypothetical protein
VAGKERAEESLEPFTLQVIDPQREGRTERGTEVDTTQTASCADGASPKWKDMPE